MNVTTVGLCYPCWASMSVHFDFIIYIPRCTFVFALVYSFYEGSLFVFVITVFAKMMWLLTIGLQIYFAQERPFPDCVPWFMSNYGMPSAHIVGVISAVTSVLMYSLIYAKLEKKKKRKVWKILHFLEKLFYIIRMFGLSATAVFFYVVFPLAYWWLYLLTLTQVLASELFAIIATVIFTSFVKIILFSNEEYLSKYLDPLKKDFEVIYQ